nr:cyclin-P3-1 [Ipomoea batatas]GME06625.1 cyclin-P3-1 [Ipomoea batatas]GME20028.1 cyclin-P3-1 [Ipomoea batatas]
MGSLASETDSLNYLRLGLKGSGKGNSGKPRVLSILSMLLESSVQENEKFLETSQAKDVITIFHGSRAPSLSIQQYVDRIFKYACCSPSCFVVAHIYMEKFIQCTNACLTSFNVHRLLITSVMVAAKFIDDSFFNNAYYARVGGVSTAELNKLEMKFLFGLGFRLHVSVQTFGSYCGFLEKEGNLTLQIERSIQACGIKESWSTNDDPTCAQIAR